MANDELRVPINVPVKTDAAPAAESIKGLRDSLAASKDAIKETAAALRDLRGNSDAVKAAKDQLKAKLEQEKAAVSAGTLKMLEQSTALKKLKDEERSAAKSKEDLKAKTDAVNGAISKAGGPVASLKGQLESLGEVLGGTEGGMAAIAGLAAIAAAAIVAVGVAAAAAVVSLSKFVIASADAARMMQLTRKANLAGRDDWAKNLGDQVDELARRIPVTKDKLNELGISLAKSRIGGQTMVDTLEAVSGAAAAAGDDLGNKLKGVVERGALTRRFQLSPQELLGMDLDFNDVAKAYAKGMNVSVDKARQALFEGRVRLQDGAAALKKAVEDKFGAINADKLLGLDNQFNKFKADLAGLAKDVDITPILKGIKSLADNFDQTSVNGQALKHLVETLGKALGVTFTGAVPMLQDLIDKAVYGALKIENYWLRARTAVKDTFGTNLEVEAFKASLIAVGNAALFLFGPVVAVVGIFAQMAANVRKADSEIQAIAGHLDTYFTSIDWAATGIAIVDGLTGGLVSAGVKLVGKVKNLATDVKNAFRSELKIQSPSKDFQHYGEMLPAGVEVGVDKGSDKLQQSVAAMVDVPRLPSGGASGSASSPRGGSVQITFSPQIVVQGGGGEVGQQLKDPSLLQPLTDSFLSSLRAAGFEVPA